MLDIFATSVSSQRNNSQTIKVVNAMCLPKWDFNLILQQPRIRWHFMYFSDKQPVELLPNVHEVITLLTSCLADWLISLITRGIKDKRKKDSVSILSQKPLAKSEMVKAVASLLAVCQATVKIQWTLQKPLSEKKYD